MFFFFFLSQFSPFVNIPAKMVQAGGEDVTTALTTICNKIWQTGKWPTPTVGVRQGCRLSPTLFNMFLERIMTDALEDHKGTVSIGGRTITNLCFADDVNGLAGEEEELAKLVECLDKASTAYSIEISAEKTKLMTNTTSGINTKIKVNGQRLETVTSFKYLGSFITDEGSKPEILSRIAQATTALTRLKPV